MVSALISYGDHMARSAIPDFGIEYPEYKYQAWPKQVGLDANGDQIVAHSQEEYDELKPLAVYPKVLGKDRDGKEIIAHTPRDSQWLKDKVVRTDAANNLMQPMAVDTSNAEQVKRGPGRPPKSEAA